MEKILVVDDERPIRNTLKEVLELEGYTADTAKNGLEALDVISKKKYDLVITDISMELMNGIELFHEAQRKELDVPFIIISGYANVTTAVTLIKEGAFDIIEKPLDINIMISKVRNVFLQHAKDKTTPTPNRTIKKNKECEIKMIGESDAMKHVKDKIESIAPIDCKVLILGENGTGKELVARSIHAKSKRRSIPMIEVNCAAIPSELIESELFGHEKGAFTGAVTNKKGKFELADGGTLFLDEVGDMSLSAQAKVLRVLQEGCITPVGGSKSIKVDVRVLAATNKNLKEEIKKENFREDLYHRLSVILLKIPPLREREGDVEIIAKYFMDYFTEKYCNLPKRILTNEAIEVLESHKWSGNIRELQNIMERLVIFGTDEIGHEFTQKIIDDEY